MFLFLATISKIMQTHDLQLNKKYEFEIFISEPGAEGPTGVKRKASTELDMKFDENGNWTLETAKTRLSKFYHTNSLDFNEPLQCTEVGHPPNKQYQVR